MIGLDTNILISLLVSSDEKHKLATAWLNQIEDRLCVTPVNVGEILRLLTHPRVFHKPMRLKDAIESCVELFESLAVDVLEENEDWLPDLSELSDSINGLRGNDVFDARIALCLRFNGVKEIATWDLNFKRFEFLKCIQPGKS